jgi:hypothetical protein
MVGSTTVSDAIGGHSRHSFFAGSIDELPVLPNRLTPHEIGAEAGDKQRGNMGRNLPTIYITSLHPYPLTAPHCCELFFTKYGRQKSNLWPGISRRPLFFAS